MTDLFLARLGAGLLAAAAPWIVVRAALAVAARHAPAGAPLAWPATARRLAWATALLLPALCGAALLLPAGAAWVPAAGGAAFVALAGVALRALHEIDAASRPAREIASTKRAASLEPRAVGRYLPWSLRLVPWAVVIAGGATFLSRLANPSADRRLLVPVALAAAAAVLLALYAAWIHDVGASPALPGPGGTEPESERARHVHRLWALELVLVSALLGGAHALLDLDWTLDAPWGAAVVLVAAVMGIVGCALAVASRLERRSHVLADRAS